MSAGWVACSVRARAMTRRRIGRGTARVIATAPSLEAGVAVLADSPYGKFVHSGQPLIGAQSAVVAAAVWNVRVLAGWAPRSGAGMLRVLLGAVEAANTVELLHRLAGHGPALGYELGPLATAWPRLAAASTPAEVRQVLANSPWGDPRAEAPRDIALVMRASLADRVIAAVPTARKWAVGDTVLLVARELAGGRQLPAAARDAASRVLGAVAAAAGDLNELRAALPSGARWPLPDGVTPEQLWHAEAGWWLRVERDGLAMTRRAESGPPVLIGAVAALAADAWRVRAALELAARGGVAVEVFDAVA